MTDDKPAPAKTKPSRAGALPTWTVDKQWFVTKLERADQSMAALANHLNTQTSTVSRMFGGFRQMKLEEAEKIARFLNTTVEEVLSHAGVPLDKNRPMKLQITLSVGADGKVSRIQEPKAIPSDLMARVQANIPVNERGQIVAAQVRAEKGDMSVIDDAIVVFHPPAGINPAPRGVLSYSRLVDGIELIGKVQEWKKTGEATVRTPDGKTREVQLVASGPLDVILP